MPKNVLVVDDSNTIRQQLRLALAEAGYGLIEAEDGQSALNLLRTGAAVSMVICDLNMPRMDGLEMIRTAKQEEQFKQLPFVMLTSEAQPELLQGAAKAGAKGWIVKPFKSELLVATVKRLAGPP
jgi:two-component system, chemotaxis family, chemotaxis protein CheY